MANETDSVFAAERQNGKGELYRLMMSILKEGETDNQETAQQRPNSRVFSNQPHNQKSNRKSRRSGQMEKWSNLPKQFKVFKMLKQMN